MKSRYRFPSGESFEAGIADLLDLLEQNQQFYQNYLEIFDNLDDGTFVARGNGFCETQYSEEFIESQMAKYRLRTECLEKWIGEYQKTKPGLRSYVRVMKKRHSPQQLDEKSEKVIAVLEAHPAFVSAKTVMLYSSLPDEVRTSGLIEKWRQSKRVILPTVVGDDIVPVELTPDTPFVVGDFDILEPKNHPYEGGYDLIVVPGMAFDKKGNRLGRGKGYYDRFLSQHHSTRKIGICFDFQLLEKIPTEPNDVPMDEIICGLY